MPEVVSGLACGEMAGEGADPAAETGDGSFGNFAKESLELAVRHLDGVQIWRVLRQIPKDCTSCFDRVAHAGDFMRCKAVHNDNMPASESGSQTGFDVCQERLSVDWAIGDKRR